MPQLNKVQKLFLAAVGLAILLFQFYKFSEDGIEGGGWVLAMVAAALLLLPALSLIPQRDRIPTQQATAQKPKAVEAAALLDPNGRTQMLYRAAAAKADELAGSVTASMSLPDLGQTDLGALGADMKHQWLQYCIPYSACLLFASQISKDMYFAKSATFTVIYGQCVKRMVQVSKDLSGRMGVPEKFSQAGAEAWAKKDFGEAEEALLYFMDSVGAKVAEPDSKLLEYLATKIGVPASLRAQFSEKLRVFTRQTLTEFRKL